MADFEQVEQLRKDHKYLEAFELLEKAFADNASDFEIAWRFARSAHDFASTWYPL
jgi:hypothetical protein